MDQTNTNYMHLILIPLLMTFITQILSKIETLNFQNIINFFYEFTINDLIYKKNTIRVRGERIRSVCEYSGEITVSEAFTNAFSGLWNHLLDNNENKNEIYEITEMNDSKSANVHEKHKAFFFVSQSRRFIVSKELQIYGKTFVNTETIEKKRHSGLSTSQHIDIDIFSYYSSLQTIQEFLNKLANDYLEKIKSERENNRYIYTIRKMEDEDGYYDCWMEEKFDTTRSFSNLFFDEKVEFMKKLDFFLNNKKWYYEKGFPYTLGIGLSGIPGTGKTSIIKAIAKYTNRHIINLSMKLFKNRKQLYKFYFESTYNRKNIEGSVDFENKILVIEDIDCLGSIVKRRSENNVEDASTNDELTNALQTIIGNNSKNDDSEENITKTTKMSYPLTDPITLDDILNIWDGIYENSGRILIITSNHYDQLDPALIRPGRIDITMEMKKLSKSSIEEIYQHLYEKKMPKKYVSKIIGDKFTPAEVINIFKNNQDNPNKFLELITNSV